MSAVRALARAVVVSVKSVRWCPACRGVALAYCTTLDPVDPSRPVSLVAGLAPVWVECRTCGWDERNEPF
jgi:hypothetical protein